MPGAIHSFIAKAAAVGAVRAFGDCSLTVEAIFSGTVSNEMKLAATDTVEPIFDSEFSINE